MGAYMLYFITAIRVFRNGSVHGLFKSVLYYYLLIDLLCEKASAARWYNLLGFYRVSFNDFLYRMSSGVWLRGY